MDLSALGTQPISRENPAGSEVRYDPAFDELQTEVDKLSSPAAAGPVDWEKVGRSAADILMHRSKDLLVASYLAVALIHTRRNDGFGVGLQIYLELIEHFWEELYPQKTRMRGRVRALEWWLEKSEAALKQVHDLSFPTDQIVLIKENLSRLGGFLGEHLEDSPSLAPIKEYFNDLQHASAETEETMAQAQVSPETFDEEPSAAAAQQMESHDIAALQEFTSQQEAARALNDRLIKVNEASFHLWQQDLASPHAYRLTRKAAWYAVDELPPAIDGQTKIPPPPSQVKNLLLDLRQNSDDEALLKAAETRQPQYIFWIDLNFLIAEAMTHLGSRFERAHKAVCQETAFLLHRLPGLEKLSFSDGTPFAAPDTRQWLKQIAFLRAPSDTSAPSSTDSNTEARTDSITEARMEAVIEKKIAELQQLVGEGKLFEAMEVAQQKLQSSSSRRENLLWRLSLSQMLVDLGKSRLALPHMEQVLQDISRHGLEQYDPSLALRGFKLAWLAFDSQTEQKFKDQGQDVLHQIGRFNMPEMVRLTSG